MAAIIANLDCKNGAAAAAASTPGAFATDRCFFSRGSHTYRVPLGLHAANRAALLRRLAGHGAGVCLFVGGVASERNDTDHEELFRQESYFQYLFGVAEPGWFGTIEVPGGRATLFAPELGPEYAVWMGKIATREELGARYGVEVRWTSELGARCAAAPATYVMRGVNSDSGVGIHQRLPPPACVANVSESDVGVPNALFLAAAESRVFKSADEAALLRYASWVTSNAHVAVMRALRPGKYEYQLEAEFLYHCASDGGCRNCAYTSICACGPNAAVLHYGHAGAPNARLLQPGDLALLDMGAEYHCYCSDITCTMPVDGVFTRDQKIVYEGVLNAQRAVYAIMGPGTSWTDCHLAAEREILKALVTLGVLVGDLDAMVDAEVGGVFLPCGLGHFIGVDCHDVGGYLPQSPPRSNRPGLRKLRTARVLDVGMMLTVEPGCYFIDALLDPALSNPKTAKFFDADRLRTFRGSGGVRLEDVILIAKDGLKNYTTCPRSVAEVEAVMAGGQWPPAKDDHPDLNRQWAAFRDGALFDVAL